MSITCNGRLVRTWAYPPLLLLAVPSLLMFAAAIVVAAIGMVLLAPAVLVAWLCRCPA